MKNTMLKELSNIEILYEDNHLLVVNKPVGVLSQKDETNDPDLLTILKAYLKEKYGKPGNVYLGLVHRLDRMTGGVMVFAKTSKAASRLSNAIQEHQFQKSYLAIVQGEMPLEKEFTFVDYLAKNEDLVKSFITTEEEGKRAELTLKVIDSKNGLSLLDIRLKTGRHHQIRVQLSSRNHPIVGDILYGSSIKTDLSLFAYKLTFPHPVTKEEMCFTVYPKEENWKLFSSHFE